MEIGSLIGVIFGLIQTFGDFPFALLFSSSGLRIWSVLVTDAIGLGALGVFLYSLRRFIKNRYVYRGISLPLVMALLIPSTMLFYLLTGESLSLESTIWRDLYSVVTLNVGNLFSLGVGSGVYAVYPELVFVATATLYLFIAYYLDQKWRDGKRYE